jgi:hypothetical protein
VAGLSCYIAGPMTGIAEFNFPAFDQAAADLRAQGWDVISPAELDRADGFDEKGCTGFEVLTDAQRQRFARNDIDALLQVDAIVFLPGWEHSTGATNEAKVVSWIGLQAFEYRVDEPLPCPGQGCTVPHPVRGDLVPIELAERWSSTKKPPNARAELLAEAERLVNGDRNAQYGDPRQDFQRTAAMWGAYLGTDVAPHDVAAMMAMLKVSRIRWSPEKFDSWADLAGYAACGWDCARPE